MTHDVVPVLLYHDIGDAGSPPPRSMRRFTVPPGLFDEHLAALTAGGYRPGLVSDLADAMPLSRTVIVSFDDAFTSFGEVAVPLLERYGFQVSLFVPTAFVGGHATWLPSGDIATHRILGWSELRDVVAMGHEIGSHGHRHCELDIMSVPDVSQDLVHSRALLEEALAVSVRTLAYPFGYHDRAVRLAAREAGYGVACEVGYGLHQAQGDRLRVRRLLVGPDVSGDDLLDLVATGVPTTVERIRRASRPGWRMVRLLRSRRRKVQK